jgi:GAF domain-containing protein
MCWNAPSSSWPAMPGWCTWLDPTRVTASCGSAPRGLSLDRVATRLRIGSPVSGLAVPQRRPVAFVDLAQIMAGELDASADPIVDDLGSHLVVRRIGNLLSEPSAADSLKRLPLTHPAILAVPLIARHEIYGALSLFHGAPRQFSEQDVDLASAFANQAALVFENASLRDAGERRLVEVEALAADNARLHQQSEQRAGELEALYRADEQIYRSLAPGRGLEFAGRGGHRHPAAG